MSTGALDPMIHHPERLRIIATLAALPDGDALCVTRLQDMLGLTSGSLITRLRDLDHAGYVLTEKTDDDRAQTTVALTCDGSFSRRAGCRPVCGVPDVLTPMLTTTLDTSAPGTSVVFSRTSTSHEHGRGQISRPVSGKSALSY